MSSLGLSLTNTIRRSLRLRIIAMLLLCAAGLSLVSILYIYLTQGQQLRHELEETADNIINRLAFTMALPLWNFDQHYLEQLEDQELKNPDVLSVLVVAQNDALKVGRRKTSETDEEKESFSSLSARAGIIPHALYREKPIVLDSQTLGVVRVILSDTSIRSKLTALIVQQTLQALVILTGISILTYLGLSRILLTPLRELHRAADAYGKGNLSMRTSVSTDDEIGQLATTLNHMAQQQADIIQELRDAQSSLHSTNRRLKDIIEFIPDAMFVTDTNGCIITWNRAIAEMTGVSSEQMIGRGRKEYSIPFYGDRRSILIDLLDLTDKTRESHYTAVRRIGDKLYAESHIPALNNRHDLYFWGAAAPLYDSNGNRCGAIEVIRDISELKQAEKALQENAAFRKRVFDSSQMPIVIMDAQSCRFIDCNPAATAIYRFASRQETLGKTPLDVSAPLQYDGTPSSDKARIYIEAARREGMVIFEWRHQRPDGELWDAEVHLMSFEAGERQLLQFTLQDITERKRTTALMIQTEKMMMVGGLAAGMAHEINNPLGIITQTAQIIQRRLDPNLPANREVARLFSLDLDQLRHYLDERQIPIFIANIREATDRAAKIIANMLKFSRKNDSVTEWVDVNQLFEQVLELAASDYDLKKSYGFKKICLIKELAPNLPTVPVTVLEIEQVLLNLLKNAAQAMYEAGTPVPAITLRTRGENGFAVMEVEDNGPGILPAVQKRIFEPFYTTKPVGHGTGLGLSVSYAIITTNHHGRIEVTSQPGQGARFTIRLPLQQQRIDTLKDGAA